MTIDCWELFYLDGNVALSSVLAYTRCQHSPTLSTDEDHSFLNFEHLGLVGIVLEFHQGIILDSTWLVCELNNKLTVSRGQLIQ